MDIIEWLKQSWFLLGIIAMMFSYLVAITNGTGKFGRWARSKLVGNMEDDMQTFMQEHEGCKPKTEKEIAVLKEENKTLKKRLDRIDEILADDLESLRLIYRILDVFLDHLIYGNHIEQIKQSKEDLHQHILNR